MTDQQMATALNDLLTQWEVNEAKWVTKYGTTKGFSEWFTKQLQIG